MGDDRAFVTRRRVEFVDTDLEGMVHFARYLVYMETAEHELLRAAGATITAAPDGTRWSWPRVEASCEYLAPLAFGDTVEIETRLGRLGESSVTYEHTLRRIGPQEGETVVARGRVKAVCCLRDGDGRLRPLPVPAAFADALRALGA